MGCAICKLPENSVHVHGGSGRLSSYIGASVIALCVVTIREIPPTSGHLSFITNQLKAAQLEIPGTIIYYKCNFETFCYIHLFNLH